jgi:RNA polymerase sigma-70 factor, ECF subfamily
VRVTHAHEEGSVPTRAPVDELVRVEQHDPDHDRKRNDRHATNVPVCEGHGPVSGGVFSSAVNPAREAGIEGGVSAAADVLPFLPELSAMSAVMGPARATRATGVPMTDDAEGLVRRAAAGDPEAFRALFVRHKGDVSRLVYRMLNAPADLEDVVQEVFVQVFRSLKDFRGQSKFSTWLHRVTVNVVLMHRRSARSRPVLAEELPGELVADAGQALPDDEVDRRERMRAFQRLLSRLADKKRIVFVLHELEGMSPAEIADVVGAPVLTVRTRLFYARRELEAMFGEEPTLAGLATEPCSPEAAPVSASVRPRPQKAGDS